MFHRSQEIRSRTFSDGKRILDLSYMARDDGDKMRSGPLNLFNVSDIFRAGTLHNRESSFVPGVFLVHILSFICIRPAQSHKKRRRVILASPFEL